MMFFNMKTHSQGNWINLEKNKVFLEKSFLQLNLSHMSTNENSEVVGEIKMKKKEQNCSD